jgi:hypothetical protein
MMKKLKNFTLFAFAAATLASCTINSRTMKEPNMRVEFQKEDFTVSAQLTGEATQVKIIGIDFKRLLKKDVGNVASDGSVALPSLASIPVVGGVVDPNSIVQSYALYDLMQKNPGYDVVMYPSFEVKRYWWVLGSTTTVVVKARLAKLK